MKQAIDELKRLRSILSGITGFEDDDQEYIEDARKSVDRIIEALAEQPAQQQEPVACQHKRYSIDVHEQTGYCIDCGAEGRMKFVVVDTPPPRKPLTDEEIYKVFPAIATYTEANKGLYRSIARAIEAAHGITGETK